MLSSATLSFRHFWAIPIDLCFPSALNFNDDPCILVTKVGGNGFSSQYVPQWKRPVKPPINPVAVFSISDVSDTTDIDSLTPAGISTIDWPLQSLHDRERTSRSLLVQCYYKSNLYNLNFLAAFNPLPDTVIDNHGSLDRSHFDKGYLFSNHPAGTRDPFAFLISPRLTQEEPRRVEGHELSRSFFQVWSAVNSSSIPFIQERPCQELADRSDWAQSLRY